jgi:hypothetical protein
VAVNVRIEIDQLVLHGVRPADRHRVAAAFERELTRLLRTRGLPSTVDSERTKLPPLPRTTSPRRLGEALARSVHSGLTGGGR